LISLIDSGNKQHHAPTPTPFFLAFQLECLVTSISEFAFATNSTSLRSVICVSVTWDSVLFERVLHNLLFSLDTINYFHTGHSAKRGRPLFFKGVSLRARTLLVERGCRKSRYSPLSPLMFFESNKVRVELKNNQKIRCAYFFASSSCLSWLDTTYEGPSFPSTL